MHIGDLDGYGRYAELDIDSTGVLCHECGARRRSLGSHVQVHGYTAATYRAAHGLSTGQALNTPELHQRLSELTRSHPTSLAALAAHRDPARARAANTPAGQQRAQLLAGRRATGAVARLGRPLTELEVSALNRATDLTQWVHMAQHYIADGASGRSIARSVGLPINTVYGRITRLGARHAIAAARTGAASDA